MTEERQDSSKSAPREEHSHFNPVNVNDTVGVLILGMLSLILLIALLRAQARVRKLIIELSAQSH